MALIYQISQIMQKTEESTQTRFSWKWTLPLMHFIRIRNSDRGYNHHVKCFWRASQANKSKPQQINAYLEHTNNKNGAGREEQSKKTCHLNPVFMMNKDIFSSCNKELWLMAVMSGYSFFPAHRAGAACPTFFLYFFVVLLSKVPWLHAEGAAWRSLLQEGSSFQFHLFPAELTSLCEAGVWRRVHNDTVFKSGHYSKFESKDLVLRKCMQSEPF